MRKTWREAVNELDHENARTYLMADGAHLPIVALALALIDKGLISRAELLSFIDVLQELGQAWAIPGDGDEATHLLERTAAFLGSRDLALEQGKVLQELRTAADAEGLIALLRLAKRPQT